jgi:predicted phosphodiesterase
MFSYRQIPMLVGVLIWISACTASPQTEQEAPIFRHDVAGQARPWTHSTFDNDPDKFTFALFSDLTGGERDGVFVVAVEQLRLLRPELIVNVGDLIEGGTENREQLAREWESFDQRANRSRAPVFYVGGNHDLTNPVMWEVWEARYGKRYYHFLYKGVLFLVLDTEDNPPEDQQRIHEIRLESLRVIKAEGWGAFESTRYAHLEERKSGRISAEQAAYFRRVIARYPDVRWTFLLMHKPAWERPQEEHFSSIETALAGQPYTVFHGHEHSYKYLLRHGQDYIRLSTTGGVQNPEKQMALDHVTLVTVSAEGVDVANIRMSGLFDKTGKIPLNGDELCFEFASCGEDAADQ